MLISHLAVLNVGCCAPRIFGQQFDGMHAQDPLLPTLSSTHLAKKPIPCASWRHGACVCFCLRPNLSGTEQVNTKLANLGPKSEAILLRASITTEEQLRALGAVRAYVKVKRMEPAASLNLLWALEGALTGRSWQAVAKSDRLRLLLALEQALSGGQ